MIPDTLGALQESLHPWLLGTGAVVWLLLLVTLATRAGSA